MRSSSRYKINIESIYLAIFGVFIFLSVLDTSLLDIGFAIRLYRMFAIAALFLFFCYYYAHHRITLRIFIVDIIIVLAFLAASISTQRNSLILTAIFIVSAEVVSIKRIVKTHMGAVVLALAFIFLMIVTKQIPDYLYGREAAHCFGFAYIHYVPYHLFFCMLEYMYLKERPLRFYEIVIILLVNYRLYILSSVSLVFYLTFITIILYYFIKKYPLISINKKWVERLSVFVFPIGVLTTFYMMKNYNPLNPRWAAFNAFTNGRIRYMHEGYLRYPITLFGNYIEMQGNSAVKQRIGAYFYIDSGFAFALLSYGLLLTLVAIVLYTNLIYYSCIQNEKMLFIILIVIMLFTVSNNVWLALNYCPILLMSHPAIIEIHSIKKNNKNNFHQKPNES